MKFESSDYIYDTHDKVHSPVDTVTIDCNDRVIRIYTFENQQVIEYSVELPVEVDNNIKTRRSLNMAKIKSHKFFP